MKRKLSLRAREKKLDKLIFGRELTPDEWAVLQQTKKNRPRKIKK